MTENENADNESPAARRLAAIARLTVDRSNQITWYCRGCDKPIKNGKGYLVADEWAAGQKKRRWKELAKDRKPGDIIAFQKLEEGEWDELFDLVPWAAWHRSCDTTRQRVEYWFPIEDIRTVDDFLHWNSHLMEKPWLEYTNWRDLSSSLSHGMRRAVRLEAGERG
ncbi:hypothetical protein AAIB33_08115 [Microbacterium sp. AZCO]|uniref:hypothetical protein n=1 Tax=Microbacterium sp. AZCO TaxID=3142976 RepID=UPI0031F3C32D